MLAKFTVLLALLSVNFAAATYVPRQAPGTQFITGPCQSDADCASGCCGFNTGKCAGAIVAQERDGGCGFGDPQPNDNAARVLRGQAPASPANPATPPATNNGAGGAAAGSGKPAGTQFITGPCANDGECASGCCSFNTGKCAGAIVAQERDGGCGFGDAQPNDNAARVLRGEAPANPTTPTTPATPPATNNGAGGAAAGSGKPAGTQFITGPCANDGECASGCCGFNTGKCAGAIVAQERDGGCGFGDAQPNDNAARKLRGQA
ncbi:biotrophy-associated secreted protein 2 [Moniliophthora roreri]|nr:biotrophy-associated secreted protein 2 [Moniliophthora roreri]